jgi:hypothetical protein
MSLRETGSLVLRLLKADLKVRLYDAYALRSSLASPVCRSSTVSLRTCDHSPSVLTTR